MKGKIDSLRTPRNITSLDGLCYEAIDSSISQNILHGTFHMQCRIKKWNYLQLSAVEDNKNKKNKVNFMNIYTNIYTYIICD